MRSQANLYTIYGYKGKQVRISFIRRTLQSCWLEFDRRPRWGEVYNKGRVQANSSSTLEAIPMLQDTGSTCVTRSLTQRVALALMNDYHVLSRFC